MHSLHQWREWTYSAGLTHTGSDLTDLLSVALCWCSVCYEHSCEKVMGMPWDLPHTVIQHQNGDWWCEARWCTGDFCHSPATSSQPQSAAFEWQNKADSRLNHADRVCVFVVCVFSCWSLWDFFHEKFWWGFSPGKGQPWQWHYRPGVGGTFAILLSWRRFFLLLWAL